MRRYFVALPLLMAGCSLPSWVPLLGQPAGVEFFPGGKDSFWAYDVEYDSGDKGIATMEVENVASMGDVTYKAYSRSGFQLPPVGSSKVANLKITKESVQFGGDKDAFKMAMPLKENSELSTFKASTGTSGSVSGPGGSYTTYPSAAPAYPYPSASTGAAPAGSTPRPAPSATASRAPYAVQADRSVQAGEPEYLPKVKSREDVSVGGNKINCWKIVFEDKSSNNKEVLTWWLKEGIGMVKWETRDSTDKKTSYTLSSYTLR